MRLMQPLVWNSLHSIRAALGISRLKKLVRAELRHSQQSPRLFRRRRHRRIEPIRNPKSQLSGRHPGPGRQGAIWARCDGTCALWHGACRMGVLLSPEARSPTVETDLDLGYMMGRPVIAIMNNGVVAAILGNGYNSSSGSAVLYIFNLATGALIKKIDTGIGSDNGLATPCAFDSDGRRQCRPNLRRRSSRQCLEVRCARNSDPGSWGNRGYLGLPFVRRHVPLHVLSTAQPITAQVTVANNDVSGDPNKDKRFVFFGTGSYFRQDDPNVKQVQTWYGLIDDNASISGRTAPPEAEDFLGWHCERFPGALFRDRRPRAI